MGERQRLWMEAWRRAGPGMEDMRRGELRALAEDEASRQSDALMRAIEFLRPQGWRDGHSGLVDPQRWFHRKLPTA